MKKGFYIFCTLLALLFVNAHRGFCQEVDSLTTNKSNRFLKTDSLLNDSLGIHSNNDSLIKVSKKIKPSFERQLRLMLDIFQPIGMAINPNNYTFEINSDYNLWKDAFVVLEAGYGGGKINYDNLKYQSNNGFVRLGIEKSFFDPLYNDDRDMVTLGLRYGMALGKRGAAVYTIPNPFGGITTAQTSEKKFFTHWGEATMGLRFELLPGFYTGWQLRMKFNLSANAFAGQAAPNNIAGYGRGEKPTSFGFNYYLGYTIRWKK